MQGVFHGEVSGLGAARAEYAARQQPVASYCPHKARFRSRAHYKLPGWEVKKRLLPNRGLNPTTY